MSQPPESGELVVYDQLESCPYLPDQTARMPLRWPLVRMNGERFDARLADGDRRYGNYLYRTRCPTCRACEPLRIPVSQFQPNRRQRRIQRRADRLLTTRLGYPRVDDQRVVLFNQHRRQRGLDKHDTDLDRDTYRFFLVDSCCDSREITYWLEDRLVAVAIIDRGRQALSAVYTYFDPQFSRLSPGVYSVLKQVELCRRWQVDYLYLGLYIAQSPPMAYKDEFLPHERLMEGRWQAFEHRGASCSPVE